MAAMTDSFGRVMLLDIVRGVALRMWKGTSCCVLSPCSWMMHPPPFPPTECPFLAPKNQVRKFSVCPFESDLESIFVASFWPKRGVRPHTNRQ